MSLGAPPVVRLVRSLWHSLALLQKIECNTARSTASRYPTEQVMVYQCVAGTRFNGPAWNSKQVFVFGVVVLANGALRLPLYQFQPVLKILIAIARFTQDFQALNCHIALFKREHILGADGAPMLKIDVTPS